MTTQDKLEPCPPTELLAEELQAMADGLRGSMWARRDEIIALLDRASGTLRTPAASNAGGEGDVERWVDIRDDPDAIVACGERWKAVAASIGCRVHGFNDGASASFFTPDGNVIEVGPKFRAAIAALSPDAPDISKSEGLSPGGSHD